MGIKISIHENCSVDIRTMGPHWGLYCSNPKCKKTGKWIQWIDKKSYKQILKKYTTKYTQGARNYDISTNNISIDRTNLDY